MTEGTRLNKYLASCGVGSRRACDDLIQEGRVEINGHRCTHLATRVGPDDHVKVDGRKVAPRTPMVVAFHKPRGFVCTREDELGRATIYHILPKGLQNLHHVGRLDLDSEGLLILTNDGDLSQRLMHPSKSVEKEYLVTANQAFESVHLDQFLAGIYTEGAKLRAKSIERLSPRRIKVVLEHGAKRQIRVMFEAMGYQVTKLLRVRIGQLWLGDLEAGHHAVLTPMEIEMLLGKPAPGQSARPAKTKPVPQAKPGKAAVPAKAAKAPIPAKPARPNPPRRRANDGPPSAPPRRRNGPPPVSPRKKR
jgi:pseudouridine synthase